MSGQEPKSIMRSLGEFVGHVAKGIRTDPSAPKVTEVRREVETERRGDVVLRRTTIEEVEMPADRPPKPEVDSPDETNSDSRTDS
ncbi:MAG: hypothetical protein GWP75_04535 [Planctomycetia bacterium]|jgi:hypothetical protein|nr:hypothetical protein [Planctomycetia bacterium]